MAMRSAVFIFSFCALFLAHIAPSLAQWTPSGALIDVILISSCSSTGGKVALVTQDGISVCPSRASQVDAQIADASHFYLVHAYGHLAVGKTSEKLADCWAAHRLADAPRGPHYVRQWIKHWRAYGTTDSTFGTPEQRIANVRSCCACGL
jgi:hypothetical protein